MGDVVIITPTKPKAMNEQLMQLVFKKSREFTATDTGN